MKFVKIAVKINAAEVGSLKNAYILTEKIREEQKEYGAKQI